MRTAAREEIRCRVMVDAALGQHEGCHWIEAGFLEGIEAPVHYTLVLASGGPLCELLFHTLSFGSKEGVLNGRRRQKRHSNEGCPTSPE